MCSGALEAGPSRDGSSFTFIRFQNILIGFLLVKLPQKKRVRARIPTIFKCAFKTYLKCIFTARSLREKGIDCLVQPNYALRSQPLCREGCASVAYVIHESWAAPEVLPSLREVLGSARENSLERNDKVYGKKGRHILMR